MLKRSLRERDDDEEWSPRTKARLAVFAEGQCEIYGVPLREKRAIIEMSQVHFLF